MSAQSNTRKPRVTLQCARKCQGPLHLGSGFLLFLTEDASRYAPCPFPPLTPWAACDIKDKVHDKESSPQALQQSEGSRGRSMHRA